MKSKRLMKLNDHIQRDVIMDVGCDHGWLDILAIQTKKARKAYACDIASGPLAAAQRNIQETGTEEKIETRKQNGIQPLPEDAQQIIIAGMGADLIMDILEDAKEETRDKDILLTLSPHSRPEKLRAYLNRNGWKISREELVKDNGHWYSILDAQKGEQELTEAEIQYGKNTKDTPDKEAFRSEERARLQALLLRIPQDKALPIHHLLELLTNWH